MKDYAEVLPSAARTTLQAVSVDVPQDAQAVTFVIDVTLDPAAASITPDLKGKHGSIEWLLLQGAAIASVSQVALHVGPTITASANVAAAIPLPPVIEFNMAVADTDSITYSVTAFWS